MPIPTKRTGEDQQDFITRCMGNPTMRAEFPDTSQRYAICISKSREINLKK